LCSKTVCSKKFDERERRTLQRSRRRVQVCTELLGCGHVGVDEIGDGLESAHGHTVQMGYPGNRRGFHLLDDATILQNPSSVGGRLVETVAGRHDAEQRTNRRGRIPQIRGGKVGIAESLEPGKVDATVVAGEVRPRQIGVADCRARSGPAPGGTDGQDEIWRHTIGRVEHDVRRQRGRRGADTRHPGNRVHPVHGEENLRARAFLRGAAQRCGQRLRPGRLLCRHGSERRPQRGCLQFHRHHNRNPHRLSVGEWPSDVRHANEVLVHTQLPFYTPQRHVLTVGAPRDCSHKLSGFGAPSPQLPLGRDDSTNMRCTTRPHRFLLALAALLATSLLGTGVATAASGFGDVKNDRFYTEAIAWMVGEEITAGIEPGCFGPDKAVTRGQIAAFLHRLDSSLGNDPVATGHPFVDVTGGYQQEPVGWLFGEGLTTGTSPNAFEPNAALTRGQVAALVWRYAGSPEPTATIPFSDVTAGWQLKAVAWMAEQGITTGTSPRAFSPDNFVTRGQAATFLFRFAEPVDVAPIVSDASCTRELRLTLQAGGLTQTEASCAAPFLVDFDIEYLLSVVHGRQEASFDLIIAAAGVGLECLTIDRLEDLSRLFL